jgi:hypothetical protein
MASALPVYVALVVNASAGLFVDGSGKVGPLSTALTKVIDTTTGLERLTRPPRRGASVVARYSRRSGPEDTRGNHRVPFSRDGPVYRESVKYRQIT